VILLVQESTSSWVSLTQGTLSEKLLEYVGDAVARKAISFQGIRYFEDSRFCDEIEFVKTNSGWRPSNLIWYMLSTFREILTVLSVLILLSGIAWWIPVLLFSATVPQTIAYTRLQQKTYAALSAQTKDLRAMHYYQRILTTDAFAKELRLFDLGSYFIERYHQSAVQAFKNLRDVRTVQAKATLLLTMIGAAVTSFAFFYTLSLATSGALAIGSVVIFLQSLSVIQRQLGDLAEFGATGLFDNLVYMRRLFDFFDLPSDLPTRLNPETRVTVLEKGIHFENVSFNYPDGRQGVQDISLHLLPHQTVAIVGENGAGKTTLVKLLARFYDPTEGRILVNGTPLTELDLQHWRDRITTVFQDFNQYHLTLRENIALGSLNRAIDMSEITISAGLQSLIVQLPNGDQTMLGKQFEGTELSGGQWQKVALARAFARLDQAELLILDEPSASLDPRAEYELFQQFAAISKGKLTLLITHRLASVQMANRILVLKDGQIVEDGDHQTLLANQGEYAEL
jgi:ATP-binding cassette subfamily B protein